MLQIDTQHITAEFGGFPLTVHHRQWEDADHHEITIDAGERDDGAVGQAITIRASKNELTRVFREALEALGA